MNCNYAAQLVNAHMRRSTANHITRDLPRAIDHIMNCRCRRCGLSLKVLRGEAAPGIRVPRIRKLK